MRSVYVSDSVGRNLRGSANSVFVAENMHAPLVNAFAAQDLDCEYHAVYDRIQQNKEPDLSLYSALVILGGFDIDSAYYDDTVPFSQIGDAVDEYELDLIDSALEEGLPVFGICRGMQLINVAMGGSLHSDISNLSSVSHHRFWEKNYANRAVVHPVTVARSNVVPAGEYRVASSHHQAVKSLGDDLVITGYHDGIVEMIESPKWGMVGVQWHPESAHVRQDDTLSVLVDWTAEQVKYSVTDSVYV